MTPVADRFTAFLDACVLFGALPRNLLLSLAHAGFYRVRWSSHVWNEVTHNLPRTYSGISPDDAEKQRHNAYRAFPEAMVTDYESLISGLGLPDPDDRHVLAAAIQTRAAVIVTDNLSDFPATELAPYGIEALSCDDFISDIIDLAGPDAATAIRKMRHRLDRPPFSPDGLLTRMESIGLVTSAALLKPYIESL